MTEVPQPHIVHLEDDEHIRRFMRKESEAVGQEYVGYDNLETFQKALQDTSARASVGYILDGEFPEESGGKAEFLMPDAVRFLRETIADQTQIIIYSGAASKVQKNGLLDLPDVRLMVKPGDLPADVIAALTAEN